MAKRDKIKVVETGGAPALKHNPFAALQGERAGRPAQNPAASVDESADESAAATVAAPAKSGSGRLLLRRETKHRGGKTVVIVSGFESRPDLDVAAIAVLAKHLKQELGCGGSVESAAGKHEIIVQGDQPSRVAQLLRERGFRVGGVTE